MPTIAAAGVALALACSLPASAAQAQRGTYVVRSGDTLATIARRHHVSVEALQAANGLRRPRIRPGERLRIPPRASGRAEAFARQIVVREGDSLVRLARRHRTSAADIRAANELRSERIRPGDVLWIPRAGRSGAEVRERLRTGNPHEGPDLPPPLEADRAREAAERARSLGLGAVHVGQTLLRAAPDPRWIEAAGSAEGLAGTLLNPVDGGAFLRGWGSGVEGYHLAIDIGAPSGTEIRAAERGLVAYAGRGIRGYGNFVVLVHPNGWVSAYAHNRRNLVAPGQLVERGEAIGTVGDTGFARGPHLHFILVYEGRHCDAMPLFRPTPCRANGDPVETLELVWDAERRPSGVRCLNRSEAPHPYRSWQRPRRRR